jgi:hypothetical protein
MRLVGTRYESIITLTLAGSVPWSSLPDLQLSDLQPLAIEPRRRGHTAQFELPASSKLKVHIMSRNIATALVLAGLGLALAGCGYNRGDRAVSGGLIGAGAGAAIGAVTGGSPLTGALIGGGIGAVGGAVTSHNDIDLGRPIWR